MSADEDSADMFEPTADETIQFWQEMTSLHGTSVVPKEEALEMRLLGRGLDALGILSYSRFMDDYTTVWHRRVYPWFVPGEGSAAQRFSQIVVCIHEHQHVHQFKRDGIVRYAARYGLNTRWRARYEAEAYCCNIEMASWAGMPIPDPDELAARLVDYGCSRSDMEFAADQYRQCLARLDHTEGFAEATREGIEILEKIRAETHQKGMSSSLND